VVITHGAGILSAPFDIYLLNHQTSSSCKDKSQGEKIIHEEPKTKALSDVRLHVFLAKYKD
jgi:hypothetical protein